VTSSKPPSLRELNRTLLLRQGLLEREPANAEEMARRLVALQAQWAPSAYVALWSRLVAVDKEGWSDTDKATGKDLPDPVQKLVAARNNGPILRYRSEALNGYLRRYYADGLSACDLDVAAQRTGTGDYQVPKYLLIYGGPVEIPWRAQYALNVSRCVGRIDLEGDALERYVNHLVGDWAGVECNPLAPVIWSVNFGGADITSLMQQVLADVLAKRFAGDADFGGAVHLHDKDATGAALVPRRSDFDLLNWGVSVAWAGVVDQRAF